MNLEIRLHFLKTLRELNFIKPLTIVNVFLFFKVTQLNTISLNNPVINEELVITFYSIALVSKVKGIEFLLRQVCNLESVLVKKN